MTRLASWLAVLYVTLLSLGRSGLPMNAQWGDLVLPLVAVAVAWGHPLRGWWRLADWPIGLYLLATLVTAAISAEPRVGFQQLAKQLSVALVFVVFRRLAGDGGLTRTLAKTFVLTVAAVTAVSIIIVFLRFPAWIAPASLGAGDVLPFLGPVRRIRGGLATPEMFGNALVVALALAFTLRGSGRGRARACWTAVLAVLAAGEFLTFSHSLAGFSVAAAMVLNAELPSRAMRALAWSVALSAVVAVNAASLVEPGPAANDYGVGPVSFEIFNTRVHGELIHYAALKQVAWSAFLEHPLAGVGPGRFSTVTERAFQEGRFNRRYRDKPAQCDLLGRLAESGLPGGVSLVLLWAAWVRPDGSRSPLARGAFAAVVGLLVNSLNADVMNFRFLWLAVAWMSAMPEDHAVGARPLAPPGL
jgi:hypothetical protein